MSDAFPETRHSIVGAIGGDDRALRARAYETLVSAYWRPAYEYVRLRWRADPETTEDLVQGFFASVLEKRTLERFDPRKARFRTYVRVCLDGFVGRERQAMHRLKRGGGAAHVSLDAGSARGEVSAHVSPRDEDPDGVFHREWLRSLFSHALSALEADSRSSRALAYEIFRRVDVDALDADRPSYAEVAEALGVSTTKVTNSLHAMRKRFRALVLERLAEISASDEELRAEARDVFGIDA